MKTISLHLTLLPSADPKRDFYNSWCNTGLAPPNKEILDSSLFMFSVDYKFEWSLQDGWRGQYISRAPRIGNIDPNHIIPLGMHITGTVW